LRVRRSAFPYIRWRRDTFTATTTVLSIRSLTTWPTLVSLMLTGMAQLLFSEQCSYPSDFLSYPTYLRNLYKLTSSHPEAQVEQLPAVFIQTAP
jgi:hypothetical protein